MRTLLWNPAARFAVAFVLVIAIPSQAGPMTRLAAEDHLQVTIEGENDIHGWRVEGEVIDAEMEVGPGFPFEPGDQPALGPIPARIKVSLPVDSLRGNEGTDKFMHRLLKKEPAGRILFRCDKLKLERRPDAKNAWFRINAPGELLVAGVTNHVTIPLSVSFVPGNKISMTGTTTVKMSSFRIEPPRIILSGGGEIKYSDEVEVTVKWLLSRKG